MMDLDYSRLTLMVLTQSVHCVHQKPGRQQQKELKTGTEIQKLVFLRNCSLADNVWRQSRGRKTVCRG